MMNKWCHQAVDGKSWLAAEERRALCNSLMKRRPGCKLTASLISKLIVAQVEPEGFVIRTPYPNKYFSLLTTQL